MKPTAAARRAQPAGVLGQLGDVCQRRGLEGLAQRLAELSSLVGDDLGATERELNALPRPATPSPADRVRAAKLVARAGAHLLDLGGKRLRPLCVALASRVGTGFSPSARDLAVAVELVHSATLLHDDVVDLGETRRGAPAARLVYGNAASIFAGDWLLVEALKRVRRARVPGTLDRLLAVIEEMIFAESAQLEARGRLRLDRRVYFEVVEGKTASLFGWALWAGARAGGLDEDGCRALERYGLHLGVAFQAVDDLLDLTGDPATTGKLPFADLREGKMTFPLIVAIERDPNLARLVLELVELPTDDGTLVVEPLRQRVLDAVISAGGVAECLALARGRVDEAIACLADLPSGPARDALETVAEAAVSRDR